MGVPKFYRWISERYPCLSQVVKDYQVGIIWNYFYIPHPLVGINNNPCTFIYRFQSLITSTLT